MTRGSGPVSLTDGEWVFEHEKIQTQFVLLRCRVADRCAEGARVQNFKKESGYSFSSNIEHLPEGIGSVFFFLLRISMVK